MACEVPAIVSTHCGVSESIDDGIDGFLYEYDDINRLAQHLKWSFENREALRTMGRQARKKVMTYTINDYFESVMRRIDQVSSLDNNK